MRDPASSAASPTPPRATAWLSGVLCALALSACTEKPREPSPALPDVCAETSSQREVTWYRDVKPVVDTKCAGCHQEGGIAPFPLTTAQQVQGMKGAILHAVCERSMPPWPAHRECNQYNHDRSLSDEQLALIRDWVRAGAPLGDASDAPLETPPASADAVHIFSYNALDFASRVSKRKIRGDAPINVYGAQLHMHQRGTRTVLTVEKSGKENACLLEIPEWNFHWQGLYYLQQPVRISPGEDLRLECHWNNAGFTPHHGEPLPAVSDLNWGEGTHDEMCVAFLYVTQQ